MASSGSSARLVRSSCSWKYWSASSAHCPFPSLCLKHLNLSLPGSQDLAPPEQASQCILGASFAYVSDPTPLVLLDLWTTAESCTSRTSSCFSQSRWIICGVGIPRSRSQILRILLHKRKDFFHSYVTIPNVHDRVTATLCEDMLTACSTNCTASGCSLPTTNMSR